MKSFRNSIRWISAMVYLGTAGVASADDAKFRAEVASSKASLAETTDRVFLSLWEQGGARSAGISSDLLRNMTRWLAPAYSMGVCVGYLTPTEKADWITSLDRMVISLDEGPHSMKSVIREQGERMFTEGAQNLDMLRISPDKKKHYCTVELAAVREYLAGT